MITLLVFVSVLGVVPFVTFRVYARRVAATDEPVET